MEKGFSLIELLTVIVIITVVLGIGVVKLNRSTQGAKLKTTVDMAVDILEYAKSVASSEHLNCEVFYDNSRNYIGIQKEDIDDVDGDGDTTDMIEFQKGVKVPKGINVYFTSDNKVTFSPFSSVVNPDDSIRISASSINKQKQIFINPNTGYITVS